VIAKALGTPFIPWQRYVADVAGERRPDGSYEYQVVLVLVPRQTGKTTLIRAEGVHSCLVCSRDFFYTAQTGKDARERWMDLVKMIRVNDALKDRVKVGLRGGSEQLTFLDSGSAFRVFAPTPESLHGYTPPKVAIDEAFALDAMAGELLMGAIGPAQFTIVDKQIWIVSTMGTAESVFLHDWVDRALGGMARVALFLWGAADHHDVFSPSDVEQFHPGVGFELNGKLLAADDVVSQADRLSRAEYERAFGNRRTLTGSNLITREAWGEMAPGVELQPPADPRSVILAYDVAEHRAASAIVAVWEDRVTGLPAVQVVRHEPGSSWLAPAVVDLATRWRPGRIVSIDNGPVLDVTEDVTREGVDVDVLAERRFAAASGAFLEDVTDRGLVHDGTRLLADSVVGLVTRSAAVDGVAFSRRHSVGDSSPAFAAVAALHVHRDQDALRAPVVRFST
jgi:hypothetical protein